MGPWEIIMIVAIALIILGPGKFPELGKSIGKSLQEVKRVKKSIQEDINKIFGGD